MATTMPTLRTLLARHHACASLLLACALMMRVLVPAGYMPMPEASVRGAIAPITVAICDGTGAAPSTVTLALPQHGSAPRKAPAGAPHTTGACPYAVLALALLGAAPPPAASATPHAGAPLPPPLARSGHATGALTGLPPARGPPARG